MKKALLTLALLTMLVSQVFAQLPALDNEYLKSFVGEWKGITKSAMRETQDVIQFQMGLDSQFLLFTVEQTSPMMTYKGMGALTISPEGGVIGSWIDNFRDIGKGKGNIEGNKLTMVWGSAFGKGTRIIEMVDENKFVTTINWESTDGSAVEKISEYTRVQTSDK